MRGISSLRRDRAIKVLRARGYEYRSSSNAHRLEQLVNRANRGLISYEKLTTAELRKFCQQRKLVVSRTKKKEELITALEDADDNARFEGFNELPAELRLCVYEILFQDLRKGPVMHSQPPITRTNRFLRRESLPIYYDTIYVLLEVNKELFVPEFMIDPIGPNRGQITPDILPQVPESVIGRFKKLRLRVTAISFIGGDVDCCWEIDLAARSKKCVMDVHRPKDRENFRFMKDRVGLCIQQMLDRMTTRGEDKKLQKGDLESLLRVADEFEAS